ncbi:MAG: HAD family phosphatase [Microgenomates group bacterium]
MDQGTYMENIKWILFDVGGVIVQLILKKAEGYTFKSRYFTQKDLEGFFYTKDYANYMLGLISHEQFIERYLHKKKMDLSVDELNEIVKEDIIPMEGMEPLIQKLAQKYKIALATNEGKVLTKFKVEKSGIMQHLSKVVPSYLLREIKPHEAFFRKTLDVLHAKPEECIFIDDMKENIDGAGKVGIKSILFTSVPQLEADLTALHLLP